MSESVEQQICWGERATLTVTVDGQGRVRARGIGLAGHPWIDGAPAPIVEVCIDGEGRIGISPGMQHRAFACTARLRYVRHEVSPGQDGSRLAIEQRDPITGLKVTSRFHQASDRATVTTWTEVFNDGSAPISVEFVSSLVLTGFTDCLGGDSLEVWYAHNCWTAESRWQRASLEALGVVDVGRARGAQNDTSQGRFALTSVGSRSSNDHLPMGAIVDSASGLAWTWQIEHNGPWQWEIGDQDRDAYLVASGPTDREHHWRTELGPGETFSGVPVTLAVSLGGFDGAIGTLTAHRRATRRPNADDIALPVIFNDYMNCLMGDPTSERVLPLIDAARRVGAETFVIDAGWYADDAGWWDDVGEWLPSTRRFPEGLPWLLERIREAGMVPGLWLEPEVVGVRSPMARTLPTEAFFCDRGRRIQDNRRYHLDFRHPAVREHLDAVVDRLVVEYGVGYIKMDYNIDVGPGTDIAATSLGEGLLGHNRAFLAWLDGIFQRHPGLVIENCASGGMRTDYAQLSRLSIHSTSDQRDHLLYPPIAVASPAAMTPEQAAIWAYPQPSFNQEELWLTMVNAMLGRVHLSGRIDLLDDGQTGVVAEAIEVYGTIREVLAHGLPHWPLGLPAWSDSWLALAIDTSDATLLSVWRRGADAPDRMRIPLPWLAADSSRVEVLFPSAGLTTLSWDDSAKALDVTLPGPVAARLLRIRHRP